MSRKLLPFVTFLIQRSRSIPLAKTVLCLSNLIKRNQRIPAIIYTFPVLFAASASNDNDGHSKSVKDAIANSDTLFDSAKFKESYDILVTFKDSNNEEILWRLSRALYNMTKEGNVTQEEVKALIKEADECINQAMAINENHYAIHKWFAIILNARTTLEGTKSKIASLLTFKQHIQRSIELNPQDPTSMHMLGTYYYNLADLAWYQKKLAGALFGTVPESSFEEALAAFNEAEKTSPNFYSLNLLMLGKTYMKLGMPESADHWLQRAALYIPKTDEDKLVVKEASDLLKTLKKAS